MSTKEFAGYQQEGKKTHGLAGLPLSEIRPEDEELHAPAASGHYASTETSYFGFSIPEHLINGEIYVWFHPVLKVISASVYIWKGLKPSTLACEYIHHFNYLPFPENGIADYTIEALGLSIKVIDPLKSIQLDFRDEDRNVSFSMRQDAIMPPGGRPGGYHFTQAMKVTGTLNLFGEDYVIDGFFSRDRSWSQERRENAQHMPPLSWMVGIFDESFAFHCMAFDDPAQNPEWTPEFPAVAPGGNLFWGYIWRHGRLVPLQSVEKITHREPDGVSPRLVELLMTDVEGNRYPVRGYVQARMPWQTWQNMNTFFCQTRWEYDGQIGYGDTQDVQFNHFTHKFARY